MSASASFMSGLQTVLKDFVGGGVAVEGANGGFSTVLDPATGTYQTTIKTGTTTISTAGVGQAPGGLWNQLTSTSSGRVLLFIGAIVFGLVAIHFSRGK